MPYELFISYSRKDNAPQKPGDTQGWVTALRDEILADQRRFSTEPLLIFLDTEEIKTMDDWRHRILGALRESRVLLVCLSPNYFRSEYCRMEWEEYLKRQVHALIGHESVAPVYFVEVPGSDEQGNAAAFAEWMAGIKPWIEGVMRPNFTDLRPWFPFGVEALRESGVRERISALGTSLWDRIQRARRATAAPGNLRRRNPHFIGRTTELRQLHENLAHGAVGVVTAVHGFGGLGKTELAITYAHGWADSYPAGLWVLPAEGRRELLPLLGELCAELQIPLSTGPDETSEARGRRVLSELKRRALEAARRDPDKGAACLLILDNVSDPLFLAEPQLSQLPTEDWLRVIITTREGPDKFPASRQKSLAFIAVDSLSEDDAARLIEDHQIATEGRWPTATATIDSAAACEIARELGGFTLAVESVAIYLGLHPEIRPADYLVRLRAEGLSSVDALPADAAVAAQMQHREKQLRIVLDQSLARLAPVEHTTLEYAAILPPDSIPWPWLRKLIAQAHPKELIVPTGYPDPWLALRRRLEGLALITAGGSPELGRMHRLIQQFVLNGLQNSKRTARLESLTRLVIDRVDERRIFPAHAWERKSIAALADLWSGKHLDVREMVVNIFFSTTWAESQEPSVVKLRHFVAREVLRRLGWTKKGKLPEPAVALFDNATMLQDANQQKESKAAFLKCIESFDEAGNNEAATIAKNYYRILLLEMDEDDSIPLISTKNLPEFLDVAQLLDRMWARAFVLIDRSAWQQALRIKEEIEFICRNSQRLHRLRDTLGNQGAIFANQFGNWRKALGKFKEQQQLCLELASAGESDNEKTLATCFANQGEVLGRMERYEAALCAYREAAPIFRRYGLNEALKRSNLEQDSILGRLKRRDRSE